MIIVLIFYLILKNIIPKVFFEQHENGDGAELYFFIAPLIKNESKNVDIKKSKLISCFRIEQIRITLRRGVNMFKVLNKLFVGSMYCVSVEGDTLLLKNGLMLTDEKENIFKIETVAMPHYQNVKDLRNYAELVLIGNVENIGEHLYISE